MENLFKLMEKYGPGSEYEISSEESRNTDDDLKTIRNTPRVPDLETFQVEAADLFHCEACDGLGVQRLDVPISHPLFGKPIPCEECGGTRRAAWLKQFSRLPSNLATTEFGEWIDLPGVESVRTKIRNWITGNSGWLTLSGGYGTGKTMLLAALTNHYIGRQRPAMYVVMVDLLDELRDTFDPETKISYSKLLATCKNADVLAMDEIEKFHGTAWAQEKVFQLLEYRYERPGLLTILATNTDLRPPYSTVLTGTDWDGYIASRIRDRQNTLICDFWDAQDFRIARPLPEVL